MSFKFDLEKIKALPDFSAEASKRLRNEYNKDAELEEHSLFTPTIPGWKDKTVSYDILGYETSETISSSSLVNSRTSGTEFGFKVSRNNPKWSYS